MFVCVRAYSGALYYYLYMYNIITIARVLTWTITSGEYSQCIDQGPYEGSLYSWSGWIMAGNNGEHDFLLAKFLCIRY